MVKHPAKFSNEILRVLSGYVQPDMRILDPFAGVGKLKEIAPNAVLNELEFEWAVQGLPALAVQGNALHLPFASGTFDCVCTSPTYANRMADHHEAKDASKRNTYRHTLGRPLHANNSGAMQWGNEYRAFHMAAWQESIRVLRDFGLLILNVSDHIRKGKRIPVSVWHSDVIQELGCTLIEGTKVETPRQRMGANGNLRVDSEDIIVFRKMP